MTVGLLWSKNADFRPNSGHALFQIFPKTGPLNFENCPKTGHSKFKNLKKHNSCLILKLYFKIHLILVQNKVIWAKIVIMVPNSGTNFGRFPKNPHISGLI